MRQQLDATAEEYEQRQSMVRWFSPRILGLTGLQAVISAVFGSYADKREFERVLPETKYSERVEKSGSPD
ncbi:MAG: hypothetical protein Q8K58_01855 [Acidimicrobiales bacterium]|nr:hypothetical protein [Acidimicrobiales bacterium]